MPAGCIYLHCVPTFARRIGTWTGDARSSSAPIRQNLNVTIVVGGYRGISQQPSKRVEVCLFLPRLM